MDQFYRTSNASTKKKTIQTYSHKLAEMNGAGHMGGYDGEM